MEINSKFLEAVLTEQKRLVNNSFPDFVSTGLGQNYIVKCEGNAPEVRENAREVLLAINHAYFYESWPTISEWIDILPRKFTESFSPELSPTEEKAYIAWLSTLSYEQKMEQARKKEKWRLSDWLIWMEPTERLWFWWGATELGKRTKQDYFLITVNLLDELYLTGALEMFFECCGAISIEKYDT